MEALLRLAAANALTAALLAVVAVAIGRALRRPALVHFLWLLVLLRLLAPPVLGLPVLLPWPEAVSVPDAVADGAVMHHEQAAATSTGAAVAGSPQMGSEPSQVPAPTTLVPAKVADGGTKEMLVTTVALAWLSAAGAILVLAVARALRFHRLLVHAATAAPQQLQAEAASLAQHMGLRRCPPVLVVPGRFSPVLWSLLCPAKILLPRELLAGLGARETAALLAHELAHYRRRDHWVRHVELLAVAFFWWYPLAWWARRALHVAEEQSCDAVVVRTVPGIARAYAEGLCAVLELLSHGAAPVPVAASGIGTTRNLKRRITMIMRGTTDKSAPLALVLLLAAAAVPALCFYPAWTDPGDAVAAETEDETNDDAEYSGDPISLNFKDAELKDVLQTFTTLTNLKFAIDPSASGTRVTARYENMPWDQALDKLISGCDLEILLVPGQPLAYVASSEKIEANRERWQNRPLGLAGATIDELAVIGTMRIPGGKSIVLLEDQFDVSHVAQQGQQLFDGTLSEIHPDRIVFTRSDGTRIVREVEAP